MGKRNKVHFLAAYTEYLLEQGIKSEYYYLGDASRFARFLLANATEEDLNSFLSMSASKPTYEKRLRKTLKKFYQFADEHLGVNTELINFL